jgi:intein-encoded DNA endonuclease-like protein
VNGNQSKPSETELAWAAGFFDGEGCIILRKSKNTYVVRATVTQVNPAPITKFKQLFGGHISLQKQKREGWKDQWKWEQDSKSGVETLKLLLPYLIVKRDVAEIAIEFQNTKKHGSKATEERVNRELEFKAKISGLNRKD